MPTETITAHPTACGETLPADALASTLYRVTDDRFNGWNVCYHNNDDLVTAWRSEGGAMTEAEGFADDDGPGGSTVFHAQRIRVVAGAVNAFGDRTNRPGPWSRRVEGKVRYQYDLEGAALLAADGFAIEPHEITPL